MSLPHTHPPPPSQTPTPTTSLTTSRSPSPHPCPPPGLGNLGNTCYLNSVVQVLYHIPKFRQSILEWTRTTSTATEPHFSQDLTDALRKVFMQLDQAAEGSNQNALLHSTVEPQHDERQPLDHRDTNTAKLPRHTPLQPTHPPQHTVEIPREIHNQTRIPDVYLPRTAPNVIPADPQLIEQPLVPDEYEAEYADDEDGFIADDDDEAQLVDDGAREGIDFIYPQHILLLLRDQERCTEFDATGQQDAHEFLRFLLDKVDDCLQREPDDDDDDEMHPIHSPQQNGHRRTIDHSQPTDTHVSPSTSGSGSENGNGTSPVAKQNGNLHSIPPSDPSPQEEPPVPGNGVVPPIEAKSVIDNRPQAKQSETQHSETKPTEAQPRNATDANTAQNSNPPQSETTRHTDTSGRSPAAKRRRCEVCEEPDSSASADTHGSSQQAPSHMYCATAKRPRKRYRRQLVTGLFQGKAKTATRCDECESLTERCENFLDVSLPVEHGRSLDWALSSQGARESLRGDNKYSCENCQTYTEAQRWWQLASLPEVLTVHLKLFAFEGAYNGAGGKVPVAMPCPVSMKFSDWCSTDCKEKDDVYKLTAVIVHEGTGASSGHYYSYIYKEDKHGWFVFDDNFVTSVAEEDLKARLFTSMKSRRTAYVLFYTHWKK